MFRFYFLLLFISLFYAHSVCSQELFLPPDSVTQYEVPTYPLPDEYDSLHAVLFLDYAKPQIKNPEVFWLFESEWIYQVDLVFTRYPYRLADWHTDYNWLLAKRLENLSRLDSSLFSRKDIKWNFILQTDCKTEEDAKQFFHGFVLHLRPTESNDTTDTEEIAQEIFKIQKKLSGPPKASENILKLAETDKHIQQITKTVYNWESPLPDSSIYKVFERHPQWKKKLVVMDWTSSMYRNGSSIVRWQGQQMDDRAIRHLVLFNDGDRKAYVHKKIGRTGGLYHIVPDSMEQVIELMVKVKRKGLGGDAPENDMEALVKSTRNLKDYGEVVLIPDRQSAVRDIRLIKYLNKPVRIVVFKNKYNASGLGRQKNRGEDEWIHPHYLSLASISKGSLHTHNRDIYHLHELKAGERIKIGWYTYVKKENGSFGVVK